MVVNCLLWQVKLPERPSYDSWWARKTGRLDKKSQHGRKQSASVSKHKRLEGETGDVLMSSQQIIWDNLESRWVPPFRSANVRLKARHRTRPGVRPTIACAWFPRGCAASHRSLMAHRRPEKPEVQEDRNRFGQRNAAWASSYADPKI